MNKENFEELKEALYRKGFGELLNEGLEKHLKGGTPEFVLLHKVDIANDEVSYRLHFRKSEETEKVYFNKYDVLIASEGVEPREHSFQTDRLITANEAYRMLKYGVLVSVNKNLFNKEGEKYNTWLSINTGGIKDENGNYPVNSYHENYYKREPFDVKEELAKVAIPVKQLENSSFFDSIEKSLKKANLVPVMLTLDGEEVAGFLGVNAAKGKVEVFDSKLALIEEYKIFNEVDLKNEKEALPQNEQVKKKSWDNHGVKNKM